MIDVTQSFDFLLLPGLGNSGVDHWQSYWSMAFPNASRVLQDDWDRPKREDWLYRVDQRVTEGKRPVILIGHSLGTALAVHWLTTRPPGRVRGAFLVAPSDVESPAHTPEAVRDFAPLPRTRLAAPATVAASSNDPYVDISRAREFAGLWGAEFCEVGELGHINSASRLGLWPQGLLLLGQLMATIGSN
jgi:predicted alpha/beta hydrolase family esterase